MEVSHCFHELSIGSKNLFKIYATPKPRKLY